MRIRKIVEKLKGKSQKPSKLEESKRTYHSKQEPVQHGECFIPTYNEKGELEKVSRVFVDPF